MQYVVRQMLSAYKLKGYKQVISIGTDILQRDTIPALISMVGDAYSQLEQTDSAIVYYNKALAAKPLYESVVSKLSNIYLKNKEYDKIIEVADSLLVLDQDNMTVAPIKGLALFRKGEYESALEVMEKQDKLGNDSYGVHFCLGHCYWQKNITYKAEEELTKAWMIDSTDVNLALSIAQVKAESFARFETEVKPWLDKAAQMLEPDHNAMFKLHHQYGLGYYKIHNKNWNEIVYHYKEAYKYNPEFISALSTIGYAYEQMKDLRSAKKWYKKYLDVAPEGSNGIEFVNSRLNEINAELFMQE